MYSWPGVKFLLNGMPPWIERRRAVIDDLEIGRADRDRVDAHQHLGPLRHRHRLVRQRQLAGIAEHPCLHGVRDRDSPCSSSRRRGAYIGSSFRRAGNFATRSDRGRARLAAIAIDRAGRLVYMCLIFERRNCRKRALTRGERKARRAMADHSVSTISIRDCRIRLMRGGAGRPLLILHGAGGAGRWLPFMADLAARHDVIVPEHPGLRRIRHAGHGSTTSPTSPTSISISSISSISTTSIWSASRSAAGSRPSLRCATPRALPR